jgi:hypothetical protein
VYLRTSINRENSNKHLDITDFVSRGMVSQEEDVIAQGGGAKIVIKSGPSKPKLDSVTPTQWVAANARIMAELLSTGALPLADVYQYLAYTCKVGDLAERFEWRSVLLYDREYRTIQANYKFPWATDTPHLGTVLLKEKPPPAKLANPRTNNFRPGRKVGGITNKEPCRLYNRGQCTYERCRYAHVCLVEGCGQGHPEVEHKKA